LYPKQINVWIASSQTAFLAMTMSHIYGLRPYMTNPHLVIARECFLWPKQSRKHWKNSHFQIRAVYV